MSEPTGKPEKPFWRRSLNRVQDFVADPDTKRWAKAGGQVLNVASRLGQAKLKGPFGIAGAAIGALDVLANHATSDGIYREVGALTRKHGLRAVDANGAISLLYEQGYFMNAEVLCSDEHSSIVSVPINDGQHQIAVVKDRDGKLKPWWSAYVSEDLSYSFMAEMLWKDFGTAITLTFRKDEYDMERLTAAPIEGFEDNEYIGPNSPEEFIEKFKRYRAAGIRRACLAVGPPGTGKTTFCYKLAKLLGGKILVITPDLLENQRLPRQDIVELVTTFRPNVLAFEDVDRVTNDGLLLSLMDNTRQANPDTLQISTANDPNAIVPALKRPGRLGVRVNFPAPAPEWRKKVIQLYADKVGVERDLTHLAQHMDHEKFTHDYIKEVCEQAVVEGDDALIEYIKQTITEFGEEKKEEGGLKKGLARLVSGESSG